jgi:predicted O-methyltransferase YrrM
MSPASQPASHEAGRATLARAEQTDGFFAREEADFLMDTVTSAPDGASILEVGSYKGRSTLFLLAAMRPGQRLFSVDSFRTAASYAGHSYSSLLTHVNDPRHHLLPMTLREARPHLQAIPFDVVFIDGDHSFVGASQDLALSVELARAGATILCHDVTDLFPGVQAATQALVSMAVLKESGRVSSLVAYSVTGRPSWLTDPAVYRDAELPGRLCVIAVPQRRLLPPRLLLWAAAR